MCPAAAGQRPDNGVRGTACGRAGRRTSSRVRPVRRPGRVHDAGRRPRRGGHPGAADQLFRPVSGRDRPLRGHVEKFIGDAVMAVWGAPTAHEDDAREPFAPHWSWLTPFARSGRASSSRRGPTGEAAVTIGATDQGMVAGDTVNTASRLQSAAAPGTVLVGEGTHRAAAGAIAFEEAGEQTLKARRCRCPCGAPRRRRARGAQSVRDARGSVRRPRRRAAPTEGSLSRDRARASRPARLGHRPGRDRQEPPRLGVLEIHRRRGRYDLLPAIAADLVSRRVSVLVAVGGDPSPRAAKRATSTIPETLVEYVPDERSAMDRTALAPRCRDVNRRRIRWWRRREQARFRRASTRARRRGSSRSGLRRPPA